MHGGLKCCDAHLLCNNIQSVKRICYNITDASIRLHSFPLPISWGGGPRRGGGVVLLSATGPLNPAGLAQSAHACQ
ncbi:hypothetical protein ABI_16990 [Asticcacaulis biprosthecium C19]|uniref:Uncharacterized protein n=1 Tax=Asticcacaulis biprosthecium C19 TaxID=715226 RepID=F4QK80_9CAUL|nr:hypothetical protein ABI_16990 [Asticcacaulis biprosthecium C19]